MILPKLDDFAAKINLTGTRCVFLSVDELTVLGTSMNVGHFHIPGDATKREYAAYLMVATNRRTGKRRVYVGKTGDNREGCNPVISRAGNHLSFNPKHSQMRKFLEPDHPHDYDFDYFYTTFGCYVSTATSRDGVNVVNEMERQLNRMAREAFGNLVLNPSKNNRWLSKTLRLQREALTTSDRRALLTNLIKEVKAFLGTPPFAGSQTEKKHSS